MLRALFLIVACLIGLPALAQTSMTRAQLETDANTYIKPNGVGAITGAILNLRLVNMDASMITLLDNPNPFSFPPTIPCTGVLQGNSGSPVSCVTSLPSGLTIPAPIVTGSFTATGLVTNADLVNSSLTVNGVTCTLGAACSPPVPSLGPGSTTISPPTSGGVLFDNAGVLGDSTALPNGTTGTTQTASDSSSKVATDAFVRANVVTPTPITPQSFGAKCDGSTDDSTALQNWLNALGTGLGGVIPGSPQPCMFQTALIGPITNGVSIIGAGVGASELRYNGASTTTSALTFGTPTGSCSVSSLTLNNFLLSSSTHMTAGSALILNDVCGGRINIAVENNAGGAFGNWWNGMTVAGGNQIYVSNSVFTGQHFPVFAFGDSSSHSSTPLVDFRISGGIAIGGLAGINIGGNAGGTTIDGIDVLGNQTELKISQDGVGIPNGGTVVGPTTFLDATNGGLGRDIDIEDAGDSSSSLRITGASIASAGGTCFYIATDVTYYINWTGGDLINCQTDGISQNSINTFISINDINVNMTAAGFSGATGYAFNCAVSNSNVSFSSIHFLSWGIAGQFSSGCGPQGYISNGANTIFSGTPNANTTNPALAWQYDVSPQSTVSIANGANAALPANASGMVMVDNTTNGDVGVYICGGSACALISSTDSTWAAPTTTPSGGAMSIASSSGYKIYNNFGSTVNVNVMLFKLRNAP